MLLQPTKRKADTLNSSQTMETIAEVSLARLVVHLPQRLTHPPFSAEQNIVTSKKDAVLANNAGGEGIDKDAVTEKDILSRLGTFALPRRYEQTWLNFASFSNNQSKPTWSTIFLCLKNCRTKSCARRLQP
jgi:hypothetical protein